MSNFSVLKSVPLVAANDRMFIKPDGSHEADYVQQASVLVCQGCRRGVVVVEDQHVGGVSRLSGRPSGGRVQWRGVHWWPPPGGIAGSEDVPSAIAEAVDEGGRCLASRAPRAAAVMLRGALALIVADRGSDVAKSQRALADQLKQMVMDGDLDKSLGEWAKHIRLIGNAGAHPSELDPVSIGEAEDLSRLMASLLDFLYVMPAAIKRRREGR